MKFHTRRPIALAAIILTASAALTACGSDDGGDTGSDTGGDAGSDTGGDTGRKTTERGSGTP